MYCFRLVFVRRRWDIFYVSVELGGQRGADGIRKFAKRISDTRSSEPPTPCFGGMVQLDQRRRRRSEEQLVIHICYFILLPYNHHLSMQS
jgi:hypothetical protein